LRIDALRRVNTGQHDNAGKAARLDPIYEGGAEDVATSLQQRRDGMQ